MQDFIFHVPTKIVFGKGISKDVGEYAKDFGKKALLVIGSGSVKRSGTFDIVLSSLKNASLEIKVLEGVVSNPLLSKVREGIKLAKDFDADFIIALGGGSVMDTSKAICAGVMLKENDIWDVFTKKVTIKAALPLLTIPTLAASGSEMNGYMVITNDETKHKLASASDLVKPKISFLDPTLTFSVPKDYTAYGGVDAVCHLLEPFFNGIEPEPILQDRIATGIIKTLMEATKRSIEKPDDYRARAQLMWGASLALCGLTKAGVGEHFFPMHLIEHSISALFNVPHGAGLAAIIPGWMSWYANKNPERILRLGELLWGISPKEGPEKTINNMKSWIKDVGCPTNLIELGIDEKYLDEIAQNAMTQVSIWGKSDIITKELIKEILSYCK